jgi:myo-inositol-1-phosphate synthase
MQDYSITCENKKVWEFYEQHQNLDFESMNLLFVNILEELNKDITSSLSNNIASQLLTNIKNLQGQVEKLNTDTQTNFKNKFTEFKKEYMEDIKMILSNNNSEKIAPLIKEYNGSLLDKTQLLLNEVVPKNNELLLSFRRK